MAAHSDEMCALPRDVRRGGHSSVLEARRAASAATGQRPRGAGHHPLCAHHQPDTFAFRLRAYSHAWLLGEGLPSGLPDELKPKAERMFPRVVEGVGIAVGGTSELGRAIAPLVRSAMSDAVRDVYADSKNRSPEVELVKSRMALARTYTVKKLLGKVDAIGWPDGWRSCSLGATDRPATSNQLDCCTTAVRGGTNWPWDCCGDGIANRVCTQYGERLAQPARSASRGDGHRGHTDAICSVLVRRCMQRAGRLRRALSGSFGSGTLVDTSNDDRGGQLQQGVRTYRHRGAKARREPGQQHRRRSRLAQRHHGEHFLPASARHRRASRQQHQPDANAATWTAWANGNSATTGTTGEICARAEHLISTATGAASDPTLRQRDLRQRLPRAKETAITTGGDRHGGAASAVQPLAARRH